MLKACETVMWKHGGDFHIGKLLRHGGNTPKLEHEYHQVLTPNAGLINPSVLGRDTLGLKVLVRHTQTTTETESVVESFVPWKDLYHYYGDKPFPLNHVSEKRLD